MTRSALTIALTLTAVSLCLSAPVYAQLYLENYRSDKPGVELDMDVLNDLPPRAPDVKPQQAEPALTPAFSAEQNAPAVPAPTVEQAPRKLNKPLFAAPIATPVPPEKPTVEAKPAPTVAAPVEQAAPKSVMPPRIMSMPPKPAARKPYNPYLTAPAPHQAAPVRATPMPPIEAPTPPAARKAETAPLRDMPVKSDIDNILRQPPTLPHRKPDVVPVVETAVALQKPLPKPPIESLPEEIISAAEIDNLPAEPKAQTLTSDERSAPMIAEEVHAPAQLPTPKPAFTRPSLIVTDKAPPVMPRAILKQAEVTMPVSEAEYEQIAENMERVPVQVAMAPPKPVLTPKTVSPADLTLEFDRTSESLNTAAQDKLKNIIAHMNADADAKLQVRAYATGEDGSKSGARSKSLTRATEVRSFLMDNGIKPTRVIVRALGQETDRKPLDRIDLTFTK